MTTFKRFDPTIDKATRNGITVDAEMLENLSELAEKTGPPAGLIPGGKSLSRPGKHSPRIQVVLSDTTAKEVVRRAEEDNMSTSKWVRRLIEQELSA